jgi:hypothetical protein
MTSIVKTIQRKALPLNKNKLIAVKLLCEAYAKEKNHWLDVLKAWKYHSLLGTPHKIRDEFINQDYHSNHCLEARHWELALQDAVETWDKNWKAQFIFIRSKIASQFKLEAERHYAYWLIKGYSQFSEMMLGKVPKPNFEIDETTCKSIVGYIQRQIKKQRPKEAVVEKTCSIKFDSSCYSVFEENGCQYIKIMSLEKGKHIVIPLMGKGRIEGNITLVVNDKDLFIHVAEEITHFQASSQGVIEAVDFGYTEI